jgi:hypothetical protein
LIRLTGRALLAAYPRNTVEGVTLPVLPKSTVPELICIEPVNVFVAVRLREPLPDLIKLPAPLITPELVIV